MRKKSSIPTPWAVIQAEWGAENKHVYSSSGMEITYCKTEQDARAIAAEMIRDGDRMVAVLQIKELLVRKNAFDVIT